MPILDLPDRGDFLIARTPPTASPHWEWLRTIADRVRASQGPMVTYDPDGWDPDWDTVNFWHLPAAPLSSWTPAHDYMVYSAHGAKLKPRKPDFSRLDEAFRLARSIPAPVAYQQLTVEGYADKPRRSEPHVDVSLFRFRGEEPWTVRATFDVSHPDYKAGRDPKEFTAATRERLGRVDEIPPPCEGLSQAEDRDRRSHALTDPMFPTRSGLGDPEEAYRLFRSVAEAAVPVPTFWRVDFVFDVHRWPKWTGALNAFDLAWCYCSHLRFPHGFELYRRPSFIHPDRPYRIPFAAWKPGQPPRLQMSMVHTSEATWLEFETARGRKGLEELSALVRPLEVWEGPPELRWTA